MLTLFNFITLLTLTSIASGEVFTALADLEKLLGTETFLIDSLGKYIESQQQKLAILRQYHELFQKQHLIAQEDPQSYVANPINAYLLIKRLTRDWKNVEALGEENKGFDLISNMETKSGLPFPSHEDLNGAAVALTRLQNTYDLDTSSLARGELNGVKYSSELSAADCYELGIQSYDVEDYYHTFLWMKEAQVRLDNNTSGDLTTRRDILDYQAFASYKQGNVPLALNLTKNLLELVPGHIRAKGNKIYFEDELIKLGIAPDNPADLYIIEKPRGQIERRSTYELLCQGKLAPSPEIQSQLKCYYLDHNSPFLKLAPFKVEEAYTDPKLLIFHEVMSDKEIETVKTLAQPRFQRARVQSAETGAQEATLNRISKSAWLQSEEHKHVADISKRVGDMTGLNQFSAEQLQVVNYGIGGHYDPHFDFTRKEEKNAFKSFGMGNRIATVLFYMSDVAQGGATAFPEINATVWPKKGTAAFWYNLFTSGDGNALTKHAACPVLVGSKWVSNKWIHEHHQEFIRPCDLTQPPPEWTA